MGRNSHAKRAQDKRGLNKSRKTYTRDKDGLFRTYCLNCGSAIFNATDNEPHPNCDQCPGHEDISRRDQESADKND